MTVIYIKPGMGNWSESKNVSIKEPLKQLNKIYELHKDCES